MDANGARFWVFGPSNLVSADDPDRVAWRCDRLGLVSQGEAPALTETPAEVTTRLDATPVALDQAGGTARVVSDGVVSSFPDVPDARMFDGVGVTGVAIDNQGIISLCVAGALQVRDSRTLGDATETWRVVDVAALLETSAVPFTAWRAAPRPDGGAWILDRTNRRLVAWLGRPLRRAPDRTFAPGTFRPDPEDPETLAVVEGAPQLAVDTDLVALAVGADGRVALLGQRPGGDAVVHLLTSTGEELRQFALQGLQLPFSITWVNEERIAVLAVDGTATIAEALVYRTEHDDPLVIPVGDRYPLRRHDGAAFLTSVGGTAVYGTAEGPRDLRKLSLPKRATSGTAQSAEPADSGQPATCWHRLYVEAVIPGGCGVRILVCGHRNPGCAHRSGRLACPRLWVRSGLKQRSSRNVDPQGQ